MKPLERVILLLFALLVIYSSIDLLNYQSWSKFYLGITLVIFSFIVLFIVFRSFFKQKN